MDRVISKQRSCLFLALVLVLGLVQVSAHAQTRSPKSHIDITVNYSTNTSYLVTSVSQNESGTLDTKVLSAGAQYAYRFKNTFDLGFEFFYQNSMKEATTTDSVGNVNHYSQTITQYWISPLLRIQAGIFFVSFKPVLYGIRSDDHYPSMYDPSSYSNSLGIKPLQSWSADLGLALELSSKTAVTLYFTYRKFSYLDDSSTLNVDGLNSSSIKPMVGLRFGF